jgi:hypothetical protein
VNIHLHLQIFSSVLVSVKRNRKGKRIKFDVKNGDFCGLNDVKLDDKRK